MDSASDDTVTTAPGARILGCAGGHLRSAAALLAAALLAGAAGCGRDAETASAPPPGEAPAASPPAGPKGEIPAESREPVDPDGTPAAPKAEPAAPATADAEPVAAPETRPPAEPRPARAPVPEPVRAAIDAARALVAAGRAGDAVADLEKAEAALGASPDLRIAQGRAFLALADQALRRGDDSFLVKGLVADADLRWKQATETDPDVPGAAVLHARVQRFEENPLGARMTLKDHLEVHPDDAEAHALFGEMATAAREWETADLHWTKAAVLDPTDGRARLQATIAKQWLRMSAEDLERGYLAAALLLPDDQEPIRLLAGLYPNDRAKKVAALRRAADADAKAVWPRLWLAHVLRTEGTPDLDEAKRLLDEAAKAAPESSAVRYNLGLVLESQGKALDALAEYVACVELAETARAGQASDAVDRLLHAPDSPLGNDVPLSTRVRAYDVLVTKNPAEGRYGNNAGLWFRDVGRDYDASLRYYLTSVAAAPDDQDFLNDTGLLYLFHLTDRKDECLAYFEKVRRLVEEDGQPPVRGYWDALENLCKYWFERGEWAKVVEAAEKRADPKAELGGQPYPSARAASYLVAAQRKLAGR